MRRLRWFPIALALLGTTSAFAEVEAPGTDAKVTFAAKVGNNFLVGLSTFSLTTDLELGYRLEPDWIGFVQVGLTWVPRGQDLDQSFALVPSLVGLRHLYRVQQSFQPYWGLGLGVQLAIDGKFGFVQNTGPLPTVLGLAGFQYMLTDGFGVGLESSANVAQALLGVVGTDRQGAINLHLNLTFGWRF